MTNPSDARRRWFGLFFLFLAGGMLIWGETLLKPVLGRGVGFVVYWFACFVLTGLAMLIALLDFFIVRRRTRKEQHELLSDATADLEPTPEENSKQTTRPAR
jgi:hypothetical protein